MKKKILIGIAIFGALSVILGLEWLLRLIFALDESIAEISNIFEGIVPKYKYIADIGIIFSIILSFVIPLCKIVSGIFVMLRKNWARLLLLVVTIIDIVCFIVLIILIPMFAAGEIHICIIHSFLLPVVLPLLIIIFFTRPKVKEQFK